MYSLPPEKSAESKGIAASNFGPAEGIFPKVVDGIEVRQERKRMTQFLGKGGRFVVFADGTLLGRGAERGKTHSPKRKKAPSRKALPLRGAAGF